MLRFARAKLRFEDKSAFGHDRLAAAQSAKYFYAPTTTRADRYWGRLEAALDLDKHHIAALDLLDCLFGQNDPPLLAAARSYACAHCLALGEAAWRPVQLQHYRCRTALRIERWRDRADACFDQTAVG